MTHPECFQKIRNKINLIAEQKDKHLCSIQGYDYLWDDDRDYNSSKVLLCFDKNEYIIISHCDVPSYCCDHIFKIQSLSFLNLSKDIIGIILNNMILSEYCDDWIHSPSLLIMKNVIIRHMKTGITEIKDEDIPETFEVWENQPIFW
jgi:hypothetical protein